MNPLSEIFNEIYNVRRNMHEAVPVIMLSEQPLKGYVTISLISTMWDRGETWNGHRLWDSQLLPISTTSGGIKRGLR